MWPLLHAGFEFFRRLVSASTSCVPTSPTSIAPLSAWRRLAAFQEHLALRVTLAMSTLRSVARVFGAADDNNSQLRVHQLQVWVVMLMD